MYMKSFYSSGTGKNTTLILPEHNIGMESNTSKKNFNHFKLEEIANITQLK